MSSVSSFLLQLLYSITVLTCVYLNMKVRYVVRVLVFLHYISDEYTAQVVEELAASLLRDGVHRG
jgi:hypothetical protein